MSAPLVRLLDALDRQATVRFVRSQIGALLDFDHAHSTDLAGELEKALDAQLAHAFDASVIGSSGVHWSTPLARARELIEADFDDPNERVAVHLALKFARALGMSSPQAPASSS